MGKITGFIELQRIQEASLPVAERVKSYREFVLALADDDASKQGARCMDCGIPFCQSGCPISNVIPDWNDLVYRKDWRAALDVLHTTNNFPEFTGRVCPAPCEAACTLNINNDPVGIKSIEHFIIDKGWEEGWVVAQPPEAKTGRRVAVVGSGPAGLACAQQLARAGHEVVVFEKSDRIGGLLRYGIPDFKMEKHLIDRRMAQMSIEGVEFRPGVNVGTDVTGAALLADFDAVVLAGGAEAPRDLPVPGRELAGVHFAMDFLPQQNKVVAGDAVKGQTLATGKRVVVIGGGDTGSDCVGTSNRQGALSVTQFELLPQPPECEDKPLVWPYWPIKLRTSSSHEEGCARDWSIATKRFEGRNGKLEKLVAARIEWKKDADGRMTMVEMPDSEFELKADLVLLAMGFVGPRSGGLFEALGVACDARSNVRAGTEDYVTSVPKVFAAGDTRRGQSLVVWAIREGRQCARSVDLFLMGQDRPSALMSSIVNLDIADWHPALAPDVQAGLTRQLEEGRVLALPRLAFALSEQERRFLSTSWSDGRAKNISLDGGALKGAAGNAADLAALAAMVSRFAARATGLVGALFPTYANHLTRARTSYRPQPAVGRDVSWRKDDSRLHIDAFPSRPNGGERILRIFTNLNPALPRVWRVGEPFEAMAQTFLPRIRQELPGSALVLRALFVTKGRRTPYDHLMLGLHDCAKADLAYQRDSAQETVPFAPGTTWICFSDQVMHAAVSGQFMLEQTIHLPVAALANPECSPLAVLERLTGRALAA